MTYNISSFHNGFGDSLQFSTLPEYLTSLGHEVNLYTGPDVMPFRNNEIKKLVWDYNPYIKGESKVRWNIGDIPGKPYENTTGDFIKNWETAFGLEPKSSLPKIYFRPKLITGIDGIIDLSYNTLKYNEDWVKEIVRKLMKKGKYVQLVSDKQFNPITIEGLQTIKVESIFHLCDLVYSCSKLITLNSGTHSLAAAISRNKYFEHDSILPEDCNWILRDRKFIYPGINYHV